jgi:hypothetical protein
MENYSSAPKKEKIGFFRRIGRWYQFNKRKMPMYLCLISVIYYTAFLDFTLQKTGFALSSHFRAMQNLADPIWGNLACILIFVMFLIPILQFVVFMNYSKSGSIKSTIFSSALTVLLVVCFILYVYSYVHEQNVRPPVYGPDPTTGLDKLISGYAISAYPYTLFSMLIYASGLAFMIAASVFTYIYVNKNYVKEKN